MGQFFAGDPLAVAITGNLITATASAMFNGMGRMLGRGGGGAGVARAAGGAGVALAGGGADAAAIDALGRTGDGLGGLMNALVKALETGRMPDDIDRRISDKLGEVLRENPPIALQQDADHPVRVVQAKRGAQPRWARELFGGRGRQSG